MGQKHGKRMAGQMNGKSTGQKNGKSTAKARAQQKHQAKTWQKHDAKAWQKHGAKARQSMAKAWQSTAKAWGKSMAKARGKIQQQHGKSTGQSSAQARGKIMAKAWGESIAKHGKSTAKAKESRYRNMTVKSKKDYLVKVVQAIHILHLLNTKYAVVYGEASATTIHVALSTRKCVESYNFVSKILPHLSPSTLSSLLKHNKRNPLMTTIYDFLCFILLFSPMGVLRLTDGFVRCQILFQ
jgi:hypothetical protein